MTRNVPILKRVFGVSLILLLLLGGALFLGLAMGSAGGGLEEAVRLLTGQQEADAMQRAIVWNIRLPRVLTAALVGGALSLGGLIFQAILRNPLAEPYILGISSGSGIGAILGILAGLSRFPGVSLAAFAGAMGTLLLLLFMASGDSLFKKNALLLSGVMVNAFCAALIMFLISLTQDARLHNILFWLMGDLSMAGFQQVLVLALVLLPCFTILFGYSNSLNLLLMGRDIALTSGIHTGRVTIVVLLVTSLMVSATVAQCGPVGFVGLVIPHLLRLLLGPDHRLLAPASLLGGSAYMVLCDLLARTLPEQGEMPAGVITALIGAPLFIVLLKRSAQ